MRIRFVFPSSDYLFDPFKGNPHTLLQILTVLDEHFLRGIPKTMRSIISPNVIYIYILFIPYNADRVGHRAPRQNGE